MKDAICTMSDEGMFSYLMVLIRSLRLDEVSLFVGDLGMNGRQRQIISRYGQLVPLMIGDVCPKASVMEYASTKFDRAIFMDADMLALEDVKPVLETVKEIGVTPDYFTLEQLEKSHYLRNSTWTLPDVAKLFGVRIDSLESLNSGFIVVTKGLQMFAKMWRSFASSLDTLDRQMKIGLHRRMYQPVSDQLALVLFMAFKDHEILPDRWNRSAYAPADGAAVIHYLSGMRPHYEPRDPVFQFPLVGNAQHNWATNQDQPILRLWREKYAECVSQEI